MGLHRIELTRDSGSRISERLGGRSNHFHIGWRVSCSCGWTEKARMESEAIARGTRHQHRPDKSI
jgi:hypothetical protein